MQTYHHNDYYWKWFKPEKIIPTNVTVVAALSKNCNMAAVELSVVHISEPCSLQNTIPFTPQDIIYDKGENMHGCMCLS